MQGFTLLVFIQVGALLRVYLVPKLFSFVKALQDIQYARHPIDAVLLRTSILDAVPCSSQKPEPRLVTASGATYYTTLFMKKYQRECL